MPTMSFVGLDSFKVTLNDTIITKRTQFLQLSLAHPAARVGKTLKCLFGAQTTIESDELTNLVIYSMRVGNLNRGQFQRQQNGRMILSQKSSQGHQVLHWAEMQLSGDGTKFNQTICRAELFRQRMPVAKPFGRVCQCQL